MIAPSDLSHFAYARGSCVHDEIVCFHPGILKWKSVFPYIVNYEYNSLIHIKESAEKLLGLITAGFRAYSIDHVYSKHTGNYRLHSVFPGAKIRNGVSMKSAAELLSKL